MDGDSGYYLKRALMHKQATALLFFHGWLFQPSGQFQSSRDESRTHKMSPLWLLFDASHGGVVTLYSTWVKPHRTLPNAGQNTYARRHLPFTSWWMWRRNFLLSNSILWLSMQINVMLVAISQETLVGELVNSFFSSLSQIRTWLEFSSPAGTWVIFFCQEIYLLWFSCHIGDNILPQGH